MDPTLVIPLLIFGALVAALIVVLRRFGLVIADSRKAASFRRSVNDLASRIDVSLAGITEKVDSVRRQQAEAEDLVGPVEAALEAIVAFGEEARALAGPPQVAAAKAALIAEIDRADRALQMVEHGCAILTSMRRGERYGEAQTAIKRGYLNILHARDAIAHHASAVSGSAADELRWFSSRPGGEDI